MRQSTLSARLFHYSRCFFADLNKISENGKNIVEIGSVLSEELHYKRSLRMKIKPKKPRKMWGKNAGDGKSGRQENASVERVNRTVYITVAVLLIVLAVAVAATSASNRAKQEKPTVDVTQGEQTSSPNLTDAPTTRPPAPEQTQPEATEDAGANGEGTGDALEVIEPIPTFILPTDDGILGNKHDPTLQVFSPTLNEWRVHLGLDIVTGEAAPVYAAADGVIKSITDDPLMGMSISVEHSGDSVSVYKNLSDTLPEGVKVGAKVKAGDLIGCVGDGAVLELADEPHLHFEVMVNDKAVDPLEYLSSSAVSTLTSASDETYED